MDQIPIRVTIARGVKFEIDGRHCEGAIDGREVGMELSLDGNRCHLTEPFRNTKISMSARGLYGIRAFVGANGLNIHGNYNNLDADNWCCVTLCGVTACADAVCVTCDRTTACCGDLTPGDV